MLVVVQGVRAEAGRLGHRPEADVRPPAPGRRQGRLHLADVWPSVPGRRQGRLHEAVV